MSHIFYILCQVKKWIFELLVFRNKLPLKRLKYYCCHCLFCYPLFTAIMFFVHFILGQKVVLSVFVTLTWCYKQLFVFEDESMSFKLLKKKRKSNLTLVNTLQCMFVVNFLFLSLFQFLEYSYYPSDLRCCCKNLHFLLFCKKQKQEKKKKERKHWWNALFVLQSAPSQIHVSILVCKSKCFSVNTLFKRS